MELDRNEIKKITGDGSTRGRISPLSWGLCDILVQMNEEDNRNGVAGHVKNCCCCGQDRQCGGVRLGDGAFPTNDSNPCRRAVQYEFLVDRLPLFRPQLLCVAVFCPASSLHQVGPRDACLSQEKQIRSKDINLVPVGNSEGARIPKTLLYASS